MAKRKNAFRRLQEIIKSSSDLSILASEDLRPSHNNFASQRLYCSLLARAPALCSQYGDMLACPSGNPLGEIAITNRSIRVVCTIKVYMNSVTKINHYLLPLSYRSANGTVLGLWLRKGGDEIFLRKDPSRLFEHAISFKTRALKIRYLAIELPETQDFDILSQQCLGQKHLRRFRCRILQF